MVLYAAFAGVVIILASLFFIDVIFRSCMFFPYLNFLHYSGITVKPFVIWWEVICLNRHFFQLGRFKPSLLRKWFQAGAIFSIICVMPALILLLLPILEYFWEALFSYNTFKGQSQTLVPLIPGVNLPLSQIFYYVIVIVISVIVHEFGHALAASREKVPIEACGFAFITVLPVAFVIISKEHMQHVTFWQQMRIYSAGIWHNLVLAAFAFLLLSVNSVVLSPGFYKGNGVTVLNVKESSGVSKAGGFEQDDQVSFVDDCKINYHNDWEKCLEHISTNPQLGYCVSQNFIDSENSALGTETISNCCSNSSKRLCFQHLDSEINKLMCLPGKKLVENANRCLRKEECLNHFCLVPVSSDKSERLIKIYRNFKSPVLYIGSVSELYTSVQVTSWISKFRTISVRYVENYETFLQYFITLSAGLAIINMIPSYGLDGQYIWANVVHYYLHTIFTSYSTRCWLISVLKVFGSILLLFNFFNGLKNYVVISNK